MAQSAAALASDVPDIRGLTYTHLQRTNPRPLQIHVLKIDLQEATLAPDVEISPDPDGSGPAETALTPPRVHAERGALLAAVNANAWTMLPLPGSTNRPPYIAGGPCDVGGWVLVNGAQRSPPEERYCSLWFDRNRRAHIGNRSSPAPNAQWAVAGFAQLLRDGTPLPKPSAVRHPRTAAGLDRTGRFLTLTVIDGRQPGYSEGLSEQELAGLMQELGCWNALNLDGGGSSVLLLRDAQAGLRIMNHPSDLVGPRPIPVLLGVRARPEAPLGRSAAEVGQTNPGRPVRQSPEGDGGSTD